MTRPDLLLLSLATTLGWRTGDTRLVEQLRRVGVSVEPVAVRIGVAGAARRAYPVTDLVEAVAHAATGLVVPARDAGAAAAAIARLAAQPEWARGLGERGRERQRERFDGAGMVTAYERALSEVATR